MYRCEDRQRLSPCTVQTAVCNRDGECLLQGTNWVFKYKRLHGAFKGLMLVVLFETIFNTYRVVAVCDWRFNICVL